MYCAYKLNKQGEGIQPWHTPFPIWNQCVVACPVLTVASWPEYRFCRRQVRWSGIPISWRIFQFVVIHAVKSFSIVNEAEINVLLELSCFFYDSMDVDNLISGSSAFSKSSFSSVQSFSHVRLFVTPWNAVRQASLSIANSWRFLKLMSIKSVMPSNHLILCRPLLLLPSIVPSIRVFSNKSVLCNRWPKYWSFSFSISPSSEYSGLISFRMDWFDLLAVQGTLNSLLQHHSSKA